MYRREFIAASAAVGTFSPGFSQGAEGAEERPMIEFRFYRSRIGDPFARLSRWAEQSLTPLLKASGIQDFGCFTLELGIETPQLLVLIQHTSLEGYRNLWKKLTASAGWKEGIQKMEEGSLPPFETLETRLLQATHYSPGLSDARGQSEKPRFFELRVYHSPTTRQLAALHERFAGPEIQIFHRVGIHPILYADTLFGPDFPSLTYLTPFASLDDREKAWARFGADPEWIKVRAESVAKAGEIVNRTDRLIFKATPYSPIL